MTKEKLRGFDFFRSIGSPRFMVAPMVDASELPFRMLCRRYGASCAWTPMIHSQMLVTHPNLLEDYFTTCPEDRPVVAQFCGHDPATVLAAATKIQHQVDAVELNNGCPQGIAKKGFYGAFLMDHPQLVEKILRTLDENLQVPVLCKIRIFEDPEKSLAYAKMCEAAGASMLTVHGRTRDQKGQFTGIANWNVIRMIKQSLSIPVVANGNIETYEDAVACLEYTGCDAVMSAETLLWNPALFHGPALLNPLDMAGEYLDLVEKYPVPGRMVKLHLFKFLTAILKDPAHHDIRALLGGNKMSTSGYRDLVLQLRRRFEAPGASMPVVCTPRDRLRVDISSFEALGLTGHLVVVTQGKDVLEAAAAKALALTKTDAPALAASETLDTGSDASAETSHGAAKEPPLKRQRTDP